MVPVVTGCAPVQWEAMRIETPGIAWPPPPYPSKIRYIGELKGFQQSGQTVSTILFGREDSGKILRPVSIAVGDEGQIAIGDQDRKGVHLFFPATQKYLFLITAGGEIIESPVGVAFDDQGALFVTDSLLRRVFVFEPDGAFRMSITKAGDLPLMRPTGVVFNRFDKKIYVTDTQSHQLLLYNQRGNFIGRMGERGTEAGAFNFPTHLATDRSGNLYVTDSMNFRAQVFNLQHDSWKKFGRHGNGAGDFASSKGIGVDSNGIIYVAETLFDSVQLFDSDGTYLLSIGAQGNGPAQFYMPSGLFIDYRDRLYVCDTYNQRILMFQLLTGAAL